MEQTRKTQTPAMDIDSLDLPIEKNISNRERRRRRKAIVDIIIKWTSTSARCETRCPLCPPYLPGISSDGRDVEEMEYTFGVDDFCACYEINQYSRALPKIRKNDRLIIWYRFQAPGQTATSPFVPSSPFSLGLDTEERRREKRKQLTKGKIYRPPL